MKKNLLFVLLYSIVLLHQAKAGINSFSHQIWNDLLVKNISEKGKVDYIGFKKEEAQLDLYLKSLSKQEPDENRSKNEKMAFWVNAYNAFTIKLILNNWPLNSIKEINNGKAWDLKFIRIGTQTLSLNNIEHDILRNKFQDARIHFAINCASISCPQLNNSAFVSDKLEEQLNQMTRSFVNNQTENSITKNLIKISKIFEWYQEDFEVGGGIIYFLNKYSNIEINTDAKVTYKTYNWKLNN